MLLLQDEGIFYFNPQIMLRFMVNVFLSQLSATFWYSLYPLKLTHLLLQVNCNQWLNKEHRKKVVFQNYMLTPKTPWNSELPTQSAGELVKYHVSEFREKLIYVVSKLFHNYLFFGIFYPRRSNCVTIWCFTIWCFTIWCKVNKFKLKGRQSA